jgi:hypothetical protein
MKQTSFKFKRRVDDIEQLAEILKAHLDPKFKIKVNKAGGTLKQLVTGDSGDSLSINKNAYHGVVLTMSEPAEGLDYQVIFAWMCVPNAALNQIVGHDGVIDKFVCNLIFSNGKDLYDSVQEKIASELDGVRVDVGVVNQVKAAFKGKSVWDDAGADGKPESK